MATDIVTLGHVHRPNRRERAEKRRQQRKVKKTDGHDSSVSSSSSSDSTVSPTPQKTNVEANQLKKLEREKELLLRQLSQLEDEDSDASRTESVDGQRLTELGYRRKPALHEVFDLDYQPDTDKISRRR